MANANQAFDLLGDPTRRRIVERLSQSPSTVGKLAEGMPVSRPAVSQHLKALKDAGLVSVEAMGTNRIYRLDPRGIGAMRDWLDTHWRSALTNFKAFAEAEAAAEADKVSDQKEEDAE